MRIFPRRLGPKLNLSLVVFLVLLGAATASLVLLGFRRTQDNATRTSREGLETQSRQTLGLLAETQADFGQAQLEATAGFGQQAARYMVDARAVVGTTALDPAQLAKNAAGDTYDPDPARVTSVFVPSVVPVDEQVLRDLRDSAVLDAAFPSILAGYTGATRSANFDAVAIYFNSVNGVTRYFPAIPVEQFAGATDPRNMVAAQGPAANPLRETRWTEPYTDKTGSGQVITALIPVYDGDEYRGIIGMDVTLENLGAQIDLVKPSPNGYAFYVDRRGELFQTASFDKVQSAIDDTENSAFAAIIASMKAGESNVGRAEVGGQEVFVAYSPIGNVGGSFALVAPISDVTQEASLVASGIDDQGNQTVAFVLVTMVLFFGAALVGAAWLNRRAILQPVEELVAGTRAVAQGDLSARIPVRSSDELAMLADSFNVMTGEVQEARELLEQRVDERTRELSVLLDVSHNVASMLELRPLLSVILDQLQVVAGYTGCSILTVEGDELVITDSRGPFAQEVAGTAGLHFPLRVMQPFWTQMQRGEIVSIGDVEADTPGAQTYRRIVGEELMRSPGFSFVRSFLVVPMAWKDNVIGMLTLSHERPDFYDPQHERLVLGIASQAAVAIENARLFTQTEERTRELTTLLEVSRNVASTLELEPLLHLVLEQVRFVVPHDRAALLIREGDEMRVAAAIGSPGQPAPLAAPGMTFRVNEAPLLWDTLSRGEPVLIDDVREDSPMAAAYRSLLGPVAARALELVRAWMAAPLMFESRLIGIVILSRGEVGFFTERHAELTTAIGTQAGIAIENARLFAETGERTRELASLLDVARNVASTLELQPLLQLILQQVRSMAHFDRAGLMLRHGDILTVEAVHAPDGGTVDEVGTLGTSYPVGGLLWEEISKGHPVIIDDVRADTKLARAYRRITGLPLDTVWRDTRSWMGVPIVLKGEVIGMMVMTHSEMAYFTEGLAQVVTAIASQAGVAVENARLFEQSERRARELSALLDISRGIASTLERDPLVATILERLRGIVDFGGASILRFEGEMVRVLDFNRYQLAPDGIERRPFLFPKAAAPGFWAALEANGSSVVEDIRDGKSGSLEFQRVSGPLFETAFRNVRSFLAVPLESRDETIGALTLSHPEAGFFSEEQVGLVRAVADQAALALENARLFEESQQSARELSALLSVAQSVASTIELGPLLNVLVEQLRSVIDCYGVTILTREGDEVTLLDISNRAANHSPATGQRVPLAGAIWQAIERGETLVIADIRDEEDVWARRYRRVLGERINDPAFAAVRAWIGVPLETPDRVGGMLMVSSTEVGYFTPQRQAVVRGIANQAAVAIENARLFEETQQAARELGGLLDVTQAIASTLDLRKTSGLILDHLKALVDYTSGSLSIIEEGALGILENRGPLPAEWLTQMRMEGLRRKELPPAEGETAEERRLLDMFSGDVVAIDDIWGEDETAAAFRRGAEASAARAGVSLDPARSLHSYLRIPIVAQQRVVGLLVLHHELPNFYTQQRVRLARAVADQAAVAIENARLFEETRRRARETEALFRADEQLFQSLSLDAVFQALVDVCVDVLGVPKSMVTTIEDGEGHYTIRASRNLSQWSLDKMMEIRQSRPRGVLAGLSETIVTADVRASLPEMAPVFEAEGIYSTADVPIKSTGTLRGVLGAAYTSRRVLTAEELRLLQALADRAAVAIDNAELYERAQQVASLEERQKLARELHDSVSQALYGIALGARTARTLLDRDPAKAVEPMDYVLSLAEAGLTEMRALIFELRPESLESEGLVVAIEKNVAATQARYGIEVAATLCDEPTAPLDVKEAAYRIAQEALHNIVKHAHASHVDIRLTREDGTLTLEVSDDGIGFDAGGAFPGHIGLRSMRERTSKSGGSIEIESAPGEGTRITARLRV